MRKTRARVANPGDRFGMLVVVEDAERVRKYARRVLCQCDCGNTAIVNVTELSNGDTQSCGCYRNELKHSIKGLRSGKLVAVEYAGSNEGEGGLWRCQCDCGNVVVVQARNLRNDRTQSCGCKRRWAKVGEGEEVLLTTRKTQSVEFNSWRSMVARCYQPDCNDYESYGGRGIKVCERWRQSFEAFLEDMGQKPTARHSIDRLDSDGDYEPGNCRWATPREQAQSRRNAIKVEYRGETFPLVEWARKLGINYITLHWRYKQGWTGDKLFSG